MEVGRHHIEFRAYADDVRIREIRIQHGVAIGAVAQIAPAFITLIAPALSVRPHKVRTHIGLSRLHIYII